MCRYCHGAPGYSPVEFAQGLYPRPPELTAERVRKRHDTELYWIIKNGIKMTGMPGFGLTHGEEEVLGMLVFLKRVPSLQPAQYDAMLEARGMHGEGEDDHHGSTGGGMKGSAIPEPTEHQH